MHRKHVWLLVRWTSHKFQVRLLRVYPVMVTPELYDLCGKIPKKVFLVIPAVRNGGRELHHDEAPRVVHHDRIWLIHPGIDQTENEEVCTDRARKLQYNTC